MHQGSYTREILSRYQDKGGADVPALKLPDVTPLAKQSPQTVRQAQQVAGELLWLSGLTRPEIQFAVGALSRTISINAEEAVGMGEQILKYLRRHPDRGLWYQVAGMQWGEEGDLSVPMGEHSLAGFCDASFAPSSSRSIQSTLCFYSGALIGWSSTRQGLTTLSTAESELAGITSLFTELQALEPLVKEIHGASISVQMHSDSQAAIAICTTSAANWRTRHLRLRASFVREALESGRYSLHHVSGTSMKADIGTKPLPVTRFQHLVHSLGMADRTLNVANKPELEAGPSWAGVGDASFDEKVKALLMSLIVASLLQPARAHRSKNDPGSAGDLGKGDWQFILGLIVVTICCWEALKFLVYSFARGCWSVVSRLVLRQADRSPVHVVQYVDDVVIFGTQQAVERRFVDRIEEEEVSTPSERPGAPLLRQEAESQPRRRPRRPAFQFRDENLAGWPTVLNRDFMPAGQDRYEHLPGRRTVLRWHLDSRLRLFSPVNTSSPVAVSRYTGRRRTWVIDISEGSPNGRKVHTDNWREEPDAQAHLPFIWIGCTELEVRD